MPRITVEMSRELSGAGSSPASTASTTVRPLPASSWVQWFARPIVSAASCSSSDGVSLSCTTGVVSSPMPPSSPTRRTSFARPSAASGKLFTLCQPHIQVPLAREIEPMSCTGSTRSPSAVR